MEGRMVALLYPFAELGEYGLHAYTEVKTVSGNKLLIG
jgi:hypothetical protein